MALSVVKAIDKPYLAARLTFDCAPCGYGFTWLPRDQRMDVAPHTVSDLDCADMARELAGIAIAEQNGAA